MGAGQKKQALEAVRRAIELGGPFKFVFEDTLQAFEQSER